MFDEQITNYLKTLNSPSTFNSYSRALISFHHWYTTTYDEEPSALLLTSHEVREWRTYLSITCQFGAATVNLHLSAIRSLIRHYGGAPQVKGIRQMMTPISPWLSELKNLLFEWKRTGSASSSHRWRQSVMPAKQSDVRVDGSDGAAC